ncbi:MAG: rhomboid family intramembrane serine protease [Polyangia bacterium]
MSLEHLLALLHRMFTEAPWALLAWPGVAMIVATVARRLLGKAGQRLAIVPRTADGLVGIVTSPFPHANAAHLFANLPPFLVLGALTLRLGSRRFIETTVIVVLGSGALVWLLGRKGAHMGASGVVFGLFGYLLGLAYFTRRSSDLLVARGGYRSHPREMIAEIRDNGQLDWSHSFVVEETTTASAGKAVTSGSGRRIVVAFRRLSCVHSRYCPSSPLSPSATSPRRQLPMPARSSVRKARAPPTRTAAPECGVSKGPRPSAWSWPMAASRVLRRRCASRCGT